MPVRRQGKLLTTLAALLGLCAAGAGCQSSAVCQYDSSCRPCTPSGAPVAIACAAGGGTPARKPVCTARAPTTQEPALASNCDTCGVKMLRPIPNPNANASDDIVPTAAQSPVVIDRPAIPAFVSEASSAPPPPRPSPDGKTPGAKLRPDRADPLPAPPPAKPPD